MTTLPISNTARSIMTVFTVCLVALLMVFVPLGAEAAGDISLKSPVITQEENSFVFSVSANGITSDISANAVLATYDNSGICKTKLVEPMTNHGVDIRLPYNAEETSYKLMLLDSQNLLKPLCPAVSGELKWENKITILSDDVCSFNSYDNKLEYYIDPVNTDETKSIRLSANVQAYLNKVMASTLDSILYTPDILLEFEDTNGDGAYDIINATQYLYCLVDSVDTGNGRIGLNGRVVSLDFESEDVTTILIDATGNALSLSDFAEGDLVAVVTDGTAPRYYNYIELVNLKDSFVEGMVEATWTSAGAKYVSVNGQDYIDLTDMICAGDEGTFYIGVTGKIVDFVPVPVVPNYGYVLEAAPVYSAFSNTWQIRMLTADDGVVTYEVDEDYGSDFESYLSCLDGWNVYTANRLDWVRSSTDANRLVEFALNSDGKISEIYVADGTANAIYSGSEYNSVTQKIGGKTLEDDIIIFYTDVADPEDAFATDISYLTDGAEYGGLVFKDAFNRENCVMIVTYAYVPFDASNGFAVATHISKGYDENGSEVYEVSYIQGDKTGVLIFNDDSEDIYSYGGFNCSVGDAFMYKTDANGIVTEYAKVATLIQDYSLEVNPELDIEYVLGENTELIYGYIANETQLTHSLGELITINEFGTESTLLLPDNADVYLHKSNARNTEVFMCDSLFTESVGYFEPKTNAATMVLALSSDDIVSCIYALNQRVDIVSMSPVPGETEQENKITIISDNVASFSSNTLRYYPDYKSSELVDLKLSSSFEVYYNNVLMTSVSFNELLSQKDTVLEFEDINEDGVFDVLYATNYTYFSIEERNVKENKLVLGATDIALDFESEDKTIVLTDITGRQLSLGHFEIGDIVAVATDGVSATEYNNYIKIVNLADSFIEGMAESTFTMGGSKFVTVSGEDYVDSTDIISAGDEGTFYIGVTGKIVDFVELPVTSAYGYLLQAAQNSSAFNDTWQIKLLTSDEGVVICDIDEKLKDCDLDFDGISDFENYLSTLDGWDSSIGMLQWVRASADANRLVEFELNSNGVVESLYPAYGLARQITASKYSSELDKMGDTFLEEDMIIFDVDVNDADDAKVGDISSLIDKALYSGYIFQNADSRKNSVMVVTQRQITFSAEDGFAIVEKIAKCQNADGEIVYNVNIVKAEEERIITFTDDSEDIYSSDKTFKDLNIGDVIYFMADTEDVVSYYAVLAEYDTDFALNSSAAIDYVCDRFGEDARIHTGYLYHFEKGSKVSTAHIASGTTVATINDVTAYAIGDNTYQYTYNDVNPRNEKIETGDYLATENTEYWTMSTDLSTATPVIFVEIDGDIIDIYSANQRVSVSFVEIPQIVW